MKSIYTKLTTIIAIFALFFLYGAAIVFAVPPTTQYYPAEILDPTCVPGGANCSVTTGWQFDTLNDYIYNDTDFIGIGTDTPTVELHLEGDIYQETNLVSGGVGIFASGDLPDFGGVGGFVHIVLDDIDVPSTFGYISLDEGVGDPSVSASVRNASYSTSLELDTADMNTSLSASDTVLNTTAQLFLDPDSYSTFSVDDQDNDGTYGMSLHRGDTPGLGVSIYHQREDPIVLNDTNTTWTEGRIQDFLVTSSGATFEDVVVNDANLEASGWLYQYQVGYGTLAQPAEATFTLANSMSYTGGNTGLGLSPSTGDRLEVLGDIRVGTGGTNGCLKDYSGGTITGTCSSDERLKTNIEDLGLVLSDLTQLDVVNYEWNDVASERGFRMNEGQLGLLAQNVEDSIPDLVTEDSSGFKQVKYHRIPLYNLQAIKELAQQVNERAGALIDNVKEIFVKKVTTDELCVGDRCVTEDEFGNLLDLLGTGEIVIEKDSNKGDDVDEEESEDDEESKEEVIEESEENDSEETIEDQESSEEVGDITDDSEVSEEEEVIEETTDE